MNNTFGVATTSGKVSVTAASGVILAANPKRTYASIQNTSGVALWLGLGSDAIVGEGMVINPGQTYEFTRGSNPFIGTLYGILASGGPEDIPIQEN